MKASLPILVAVAALPAMMTARAQSPDHAVEVARTPTDLLGDAVTTLGRRRSIVAKIRHQGEIYGREVIGSGEFVQGPASSRTVRYELRLHAGSRQVDFLEINDGLHLWRRIQFDKEPDVERIDVERILAAEQKARGGPATDPTALLSLGGLGRLLSTLADDYDFSQALPPSNLGDVPVDGIVGRLRPEALERYKVKTGEGLRPHVPDVVVLSLGHDDLFPYRIDFCRSARGAGEGSGAIDRRLLRLEFFEVQFDVPVDASRFVFRAEHIPFVDITDRVLAEREKMRR
jgi:hypothetical protein